MDIQEEESYEKYLQRLPQTIYLDRFKIRYYLEDKDINWRLIQDKEALSIFTIQQEDNQVAYKAGYEFKQNPDYIMKYLKDGRNYSKWWLEVESAMIIQLLKIPNDIFLIKTRLKSLKSTINTNMLRTFFLSDSGKYILVQKQINHSLTPKYQNNLFSHLEIFIYLTIQPTKGCYMSIFIEYKLQNPKSHKLNKQGNEWTLNFFHSLDNFRYYLEESEILDNLLGGELVTPRGQNIEHDLSTYLVGAMLRAQGEEEKEKYVLNNDDKKRESEVEMIVHPLKPIRGPWRISRKHITKGEDVVYWKFKQLTQSRGYNLGENEIIRLLRSRNYNIPNALTLFNRIQKWRSLNKEVHKSEIHDELNWRSILFIPKDKYEQPCIYIRTRNLRPKYSSEIKMRKYFVYAMDTAIKMMGKDIDKFTWFVDFKGCGLDNFNIRQMKELAPIFSDIFPDRMYRLFLLRGNWVMTILWKIVKTFMDKITIDKVRFLDGKKMHEILLDQVAAENLPIELGGKLDVETVPTIDI